MKKLLLVTIFIVSMLYGMSAYAADPVASAYFYDKGVVEENLRAVCANTPIYKNSEREGIHGWFMDVYRANNSINFSVLNATKEDYGKNYRLDVTYYDEKSGYFTLMYNTSEGQKTNEHVLLTGSNEWKTHSFYLYDAYFNKTVYGSNDFHLTVYDPQYEYSDFGVLVSEVKLYSLGTQTVTSTKMETSGSDTIFFDQEVSLDFTVENKGETFNGVLNFQVIDDNETVLYSEQRNVTFYTGDNLFNLKPDIDAYGVFTTKVKVESLQNKYEEHSVFSFSKVNSSDGELVNRDFGASIHLSYPWRTYDAALHTTLMKHSGMGIVRDEINWDLYETEKGVYKFTDNHVKELHALKEKDLDVLLVLGFSNPLYVTRAEGEGKNFPVSKEELDAFYQYVYHLVKDTMEYADYYEVWNEYNLPSQNMSTEEYVNILKTAYNAAKSANPDCKIVGMVLCSVNSTKELAKAIALGAMDYMDIISTHYYAIHEANRGPEKSYLNTELSEIKTLCQDKELWLTETGWSTHYKGLSDIEGASYASRILLWNAYKKFADKVFWYDWHDDGKQKNNPEHNYGMLGNNFSAKRVYAAIANYNKNIAQATHCDVKIFESTYMHKLVRQNGNHIYAIYDYKDANEIKVYTKADNVTLMDNYGTKKNIVVENGIFELEISGSPIYVETSGEEVYLEYNLASVSFEKNAIEQYGIKISGSSVGASSEILADVISVGNFEGYKNLEVDVIYEDSKDGFFTLCYDSADGEKYTETVYTKGTENLVKHTFLLQNARFSNGIDGSWDFKLTGKDENGHGSPVLTGIKSITVKDSNTISPVEIKAEDVLFNMNEPQNIKVELQNFLNKTSNVLVRYTVLTESGENYKEYAKKVNLEQLESIETVLKTTICDYGNFLLKIEVIDEENSIYSQKYINVTIKRTSHGRYNLEKLGMSVDADELSAFKDTGAKFLYTKLSWNEFEKEKEVYQLPFNFLNNIKQMKQEGYEIIIEVDYFNELYDAEDKNSFQNFIYALAEKTSKYCNVFALRYHGDMDAEEYVCFAQYAKEAMANFKSAEMLLAAEIHAERYADMVILNNYDTMDKPIILSYQNTGDVLEAYLNFLENQGNGLFLIEDIENAELANLSAVCGMLENCRFIGKDAGVYSFEDENGKKAYVISPAGNDEEAVFNTEYKSITFFDPNGNFMQETTSEDGTYAINAGEQFVFALKPKETVWIDYPNQLICIKDSTDYAQEQNVNITVFHEYAKENNPFGIAFVDQRKTDKNGNYEFAFDILGGKGIYRVVVTNNGGFKKEYNIEVNRIVNANIHIKDENGNEITKILDIADLKSEKLYVRADLENEFNVKRECMLIVCGYKDAMLKFCNIEKGSLDNAFSLDLSLEFDTTVAKNVDSIKIFIWDKNSLECLTDNIHLN